jgi:polygalacturonase
VDRAAALGWPRASRRGEIIREPTLSKKHPLHSPPGLARIIWAASVLLCVACSKNDDIASVTYACGSVDPSAASGAGDPVNDCADLDAMLPPEPTLPADPDPSCILKAQQATSEIPPAGWIPDESNGQTTVDTARIGAALKTCKVVKLVTDGANNAFVSGHITLASATLWVDTGVTLYASRNPALFIKTQNCGVAGVNDSGACNDFITVSGASPAVVGDGIIDGQGGEPLIEPGNPNPPSWWQLSGALQQIDGSIGNPTLINLSTGTTGFVLYRITLHNSPKFHVKITSYPAAGPTVCTTHGDGFKVWGITILTPSRWFNSQGLVMSPHISRNTDGVDPGETSVATCGVMVHNTISTGDDHIALKGGHAVWNVLILHNHFGTGHGMSIGSETYGVYPAPDGTVLSGVSNVRVCDLTIDADSRPVGNGASPGDFNGIRVKSDSSRGGVVDDVIFKNVCMRDVNNAILVSTAYNPLFAGTNYPQFKAITFQNIHDVTCMGLNQPVVTLNGFSPAYPAGPLTLDNLTVDNIGPLAVEAEFSNIFLGPGAVNFMPSGLDVTVTNNITDTSAPTTCVFPTLPAPQPPAGWLR